jgi:hypothetical protein
MFFILAAAAAVFAAEVKSPAVLLQQGIYAEETEGNLEKAMEIYSQIRSDYNDVERVTAIATYQLGLCNLKKDKKQEAIKLFQEVVNYYPEQKVAAKKAQQQLDKLGFIKDADKNIFEILDVEACAFIGSKYGEACAEAGMRKLYSTSHIYVVNKDFAIRTGGMGYAMNWTDKPITGKYRLSGTTSPNQKLYDSMNSLIDVEIVPDANRSNFYNIYWTPKEPLQPGGFFSYGWETDGSKALAKTEQGYQLKMNNHFGDHCFETFFLAVPEGMHIVKKSEEYTGKKTLDGWDIYWWKKEVPENTDHTVNIYLTRPIELVQEIHYDIEPNGLMHYYMPNHIKNNGTEPIPYNQFRNSDFVNLAKIIDGNNRSVEFIATHEGNHYRYKVTFNPPIKPGEELSYTMYGTMTGLISPIPDMKDAYQYYMKHHPGSNKPTMRIETYLLPKGAEVISTVPPNMKRTEKNGRIELGVEEVIPAGGSITTSFQYKLTGAINVSPLDMNKIVQKAVLTISTCAETDPRVAESLKSLKGLDQNLVVSEIVKYLDDPMATVRRSAIYILWQGGFESIAPAEEKLLRLCKHEENFTRGMAAITLGAAKVSSSFETLKDMTLNDKDGYVRRCAAYALGLCGDKAALPTLQKALDDTDSMVKSNAQAAITMLTKLNDPNSK